MNQRTVNREDIYAAIFARLEELRDKGVIKNCSRILQHWEDVDAQQQPFVCMVQQPEELTYTLGAGTPTKLKGEVALVVYAAQGGDQKAVVAQQLNVVIDAIERKFMPPDARDNGRNTLDGLVHDCRAFGTIELDEGTLGTQAVAIVPVKYLVG